MSEQQTADDRPALVVVDGLEVRVRMHASRTSAVASFVDDQGCEQHLSLVACLAGGAISTSVPRGYETQMRTLGRRLWPEPRARR
jgi:hypothetical protein